MTAYIKRSSEYECGRQDQQEDGKLVVKIVLRKK